MAYNLNIADWCQLISVPLELIGASLAFIEIFFPDLARRIENIFDNLPNKLITKLIEIYANVIETSKIILVRVVSYGCLGTVITIFLIITVWLILPKHFESFNEYWDLESLVGWAIFILLMCFPVLMSLIIITTTIILFTLIIILSPISLLLALFDKIGKGHALGGLGIFLAAIGLILNFYQTFDLISNKLF